MSKQKILSLEEYRWLMLLVLSALALLMFFSALFFHWSAYIIIPVFFLSRIFGNMETEVKLLLANKIKTGPL